MREERRGGNRGGRGVCEQEGMGWGGAKKGREQSGSNQGAIREQSGSNHGAIREQSGSNQQGIVQMWGLCAIL